MTVSERYNKSNRLFGGYYLVRYRKCTAIWGYCYHPQCQNLTCRKRYRWSIQKRISLGIQKALSEDSLLRLLTFTPMDIGQETYRLDVIEQLKADIQEVGRKFMAKFRHKIPDISVMWWRVWGLKQKSFPHQLHVHQLFTCTTDYDPLNDAKLMQWLVDLAQRYNLRVHVEAVTDPDGIANYMAYKNLSELDAIDLPPRFQRFQCSRNAPKMDWQIRKAIRRKAKQVLEQFKAYLNKLFETFPILYWEHWCKWSKNLSYHLLQQRTEHGVTWCLHSSLRVALPVVIWFILLVAILWHKIYYDILWLNRLKTTDETLDDKNGERPAYASCLRLRRTRFNR